MKGFSTIEMMIAMAIMTIVLSAVVMVSFGNQFALAGTQTNAEAMNIAQELLEQEQAQGRKDFNLVNNIASTTEGIYEKAVYTRLQSDFLTKEVKAIVSWKNERLGTSTLELTTLISNFDTPVGGNTCDSNPSGNWSSPVIENATTNFAQLIGDASGTYTLSDVDAYKNRLYVTASSVSGDQTPTFFVFDISNPTTPSLLGKIDNEGPSGGNSPTGLNAVRVAEDPVSGHPMAYLASASNSNYSTCNPVTDKKCGQIVIMDVQTPVISGWSPSMKNFMIASSTSPNVSGQKRGLSIHYKNGYLILGLSALAGTGPELHLIDVHELANVFSLPNIITPFGSYAVGHDVNAIAMRGTYAYVATPNTQELQVLDMQNPSSISVIGGFSSGLGTGNGKSLHLVGNSLYLGKTVPNAGSDFHVLDITSSASPTELGGIELPSSANAVMQRDYLSFIVTNSELRIHRTDDPSLPQAWGAISLPGSSSSPIPEPSMDCEANRIYITSNNSSGQGFLSVVTSS